MQRIKIVLNNTTRIFFTSDTHFGHKNICEGTSGWVDKTRTRKFKDLHQMNSVIVDNINSLIGENDILFHLGDWSFGGKDNIKFFRDKIKCKNIHLIMGNHDQHIPAIQREFNLFTTTHDLLNLKIVTVKGEKYDFFLSHFPICSWEEMGKGVMHLHGHVHLTPEIRISNCKAMDVGMDGNYLKPIELTEVVDLLKDQPIEPLFLKFDHHVL